MDETLFLKCLIDENRRAILRELAEGELSVGEIAQRLGMEQSLCSHHLAKLRGCGLLVAEQRGRSVYYSIPDDSLTALLDRLGDVSDRIGTCQSECE